MKGILQTIDGDVVTDFEMPPFLKLPEAAIFGSHVFTLVPKTRPAGGTEPHGPDDQPVYVEGLAWSVDASKAFEEGGLAGGYTIKPVDTLPAGSHPVPTINEPITILPAKEGFRILVDAEGARYVPVDLSLSSVEEAQGDLGMIGYNAYSASTGGVSLATGDKLPEWDALKPAIQDAWGQAAMAVGAAITPGTVFEVAGDMTDVSFEVLPHVEGLTLVIDELGAHYQALADPVKPVVQEGVHVTELTPVIQVPKPEGHASAETAQGEGLVKDATAEELAAAEEPKN